MQHSRNLPEFIRVRPRRNRRNLKLHFPIFHAKDAFSRRETSNHFQGRSAFLTRPIARILDVRKAILEGVFSAVPGGNARLGG